MPTRHIPLLEKEYYHIFNRGYLKHILFHDTQDFKRFYETIIRYNKVYTTLKILSYAFLPNHFHCIITSDVGEDISHFMRKIQQSYMMYYRSRYSSSPDSKKYNLRGPLFEGRFKAKHIQDETYLHQCIAYVNFNPLKHEIVNNIDDYPWTSYHQLGDTSKIKQYKDMLLGELEY